MKWFLGHFFEYNNILRGGPVFLGKNLTLIFITVIFSSYDPG